MKAHELAQQAADILKQRGIENGYDAGEERSAAKIATVFNAITGHNLTEQDAWMFLICLKLVRQGRKHQTDNLLDLSNYALLLAESHGNQDGAKVTGGAYTVTMGVGARKSPTINDAVLRGTITCNNSAPVSHQTMLDLGYELKPTINDELLSEVVKDAIRRMCRPGGALWGRK